MIFTLFKRELASYFSTPLAYVFLMIFLVLTGVFTFEIGNFYERGQADLQTFFLFHPFLYLFLVPAIAMRLWADERKTGSIELLLTLPITMWQAVVAKFLAAWIFIGLSLMLTAPLWITVNYLGEPDNGTVFAAYLGSWLMAGGFLAIGSCLSAATRSQVIAFILTAVVCFLFVAAGWPVVLNFISGFVPTELLQAISSMSFFSHFQAISKGVIDLRDIIYFAAVILVWLYATALVIDMKKAD